jgi:hypothetical protein
MDAYRITKLALEFLEPLAAATESPAAEADLLGRLGYAPPDGFTLLSGLGTSVDGLAGAAIELADTPADADESTWLSKLADVTAALALAVVAVQNVVSGLPQSTLQDPFVTGTGILQVLPTRLANHLVATFLGRRMPAVYAILVITGVLEVTVHEAPDPPEPYVTGFVEHTLHWDAIPQVITDPLKALRTRYRWADPNGIDSDLILRDLRTLASGFGLRAELLAVDRRAKAAFDLALAGDGTVPAAPDTLAVRAPILPLPGSPLGIELYPVADPAGVVDGLGAALYLDATVHTSIQLTNTLRAELTLGGYATGLGVVFRRGRDAKVTTPVFDGGLASALSGVEIDVAVALVLERPGGPLIPLGSAAGTHLEIGSVTTTVSAGKPVSGPVDLGAEIKLAKGALVVRGGDGDGFIGKLIGNGFTISFDVTVGFSTSRGLYFSGAGGIEFTIPIHEDLFGVIVIESIYVAIRLDASKVSLILAASASAQLGPISASIDRVGLRMDYALPQAGESLSSHGPKLNFKPPDGAGLALDAGPISGGGYLFIDSEAGKYAGILQLSIADTLAITAIGLIATKMPDGRPGFSLLVIITAEFPPIQLSMGFTLNGLGGLLGLNRTMDVVALRAGVRNRGVDSVLFPPHPVQNAPRIIHDLEAFFPVAPGKLLIGAMVAIGWGSPSLVKVELGIVLEIPPPIRIALLGRLTVALPTEDAGVLLLHVDILGLLDIDARELSIDATIYDSRLAAFTLTGDFAVRLNFGATPAFAVSAGGFNPRFTPPPGFPELRRIQIALATSDNPRVRLDSYMATTPTSVQAGAHVDIFAEADFGALGKFTAMALLGFDALVYLQPRFSFIVEMGGKAAILRNGNPILNAEVNLTLTGPEPFHVSGYAEIDFFGKHRIGFDKTIGQEPPPAAPPPGDPIGDLVTALGRPGNWRTVLPTDAGTMVVLRQPDDTEAEQLLLHPFGAVSVAQRIAPLGVHLDKYAGAAVPAGAEKLSVAVTVAGHAATGTEARDPFPAGQFFELTDEAKITGEAFPRLVSGLTDIRVPAVPATAPSAVDGGEGYDTAVVNPASWRPARVTDAYSFDAATLAVLTGTGAAGRAWSGGYRGPSLGLATAEKGYRLARTDDLTAADPTTYPSTVDAEAARAAAGGSGLQVVGAHEVARS